MGSRKYFATYIFLIGFSQVANANETGLSKQFSACIDKSGGVTATMLDCIGSETKGQDVRLNKAYKKVMNRTYAEPSKISHDEKSCDSVS
jgi:uncharacterized protein YecT (DUF1311 family)